MVAPRFETVAAGRGGAVGREALELCDRAGLTLDGWQQRALVAGLRTVGRPRRWAAFEVGVNVSRQNGKGGILEARELVGLFSELVDERLVIHSSHQFDTSLEAFRRLLDLIEDTPDFDRQVKRVARSHGEEGIELLNRKRIRFRTRTKGGGRGFSCDCLILDEAMILPEVSHGALLPTLSARRNPQVWYTGSAVDQLVHEHGHVFARLRDRGLKHEPGLTYLEWSAAGELATLGDVIDDRAEWERANPALGIRISEDHVAAERRSMDERTFAVERLGIGDWPTPHSALRQLIDVDAWQQLADPGSEIAGPLCLAFDVTPDREHAVICAAGRRPDGLLHVEKVDQHKRTRWLPERLVELCEAHPVRAIVCDSASPAAALARPIANLGLELEQTTARDYAAACGLFYDLVSERQLRHLGTDELETAVRGASSRPLGDAWAWSRKLSTVDISPLVAGTLALWAASLKLTSVYDDRGLIAI